MAGQFGSNYNPDFRAIESSMGNNLKPGSNLRQQFNHKITSEFTRPIVQQKQLDYQHNRDVGHLIKEKAVK